MEYEVKFKINNPKAMIALLKRLKARDLGKRKETDIYLARGESAVRARKFGRGGLVTVKRNVIKKVKAKIKQEIQTEVEDIESMIEIFENLGFTEEKRKEKIRHTFRLKDVLVLIDRLPFLGYFVELEASSSVKLRKTAEKLSLPYLKADCSSYNDLFRDYYLTNLSRFSKADCVLAFTFKSEKELCRTNKL